MRLKFPRRSSVVNASVSKATIDVMKENSTIDAPLADVPMPVAATAEYDSKDPMEIRKNSLDPEFDVLIESLEMIKWPSRALSD
jgi:hypothetical protein